MRLSVAAFTNFRHKPDHSRKNTYLFLYLCVCCSRQLFFWLLREFWIFPESPRLFNYLLQNKINEIYAHEKFRCHMFLLRIIFKLNSRFSCNGESYYLLTSIYVFIANMYNFGNTAMRSKLMKGFRGKFMKYFRISYFINNKMSCKYHDPCLNCGIWNINN